jgi:hypothetical protein
MKECEYKGEFSSWESVVRQFTGNTWRDDPCDWKSVCDPDEVLYANYDCPPYEGYALVMWRKGRKYYILQGSHCSCYGLGETGWSPEEFKSKKDFKAFLEKAPYYHFDDDVKELLKRL